MCVLCCMVCMCSMTMQCAFDRLCVVDGKRQQGIQVHATTTASAPESNYIQSY